MVDYVGWIPATPIRSMITRSASYISSLEAQSLRYSYYIPRNKDLMYEKQSPIIVIRDPIPHLGHNLRCISAHLPRTDLDALARGIFWWRRFFFAFSDLSWQAVGIYVGLLRGVVDWFDLRRWKRTDQYTMMCRSVILAEDHLVQYLSIKLCSHESFTALVSCQDWLCG